MIIKMDPAMNHTMNVMNSAMNHTMNVMNPAMNQMTIAPMKTNTTGAQDCPCAPTQSYLYLYLTVGVGALMIIGLILFLIYCLPSASHCQMNRSRIYPHSYGMLTSYVPQRVISSLMSKPRSEDQTQMLVDYLDKTRDKLSKWNLSDSPLCGRFIRLSMEIEKPIESAESIVL